MWLSYIVMEFALARVLVHCTGMVLCYRVCAWPYLLIYSFCSWTTRVCLQQRELSFRVTLIACADRMLAE